MIIATIKEIKPFSGIKIPELYTVYEFLIINEKVKKGKHFICK